MVEMKDSGSRQEFTTGAVRDAAEGKPQPSLLSPWVWKVLVGGRATGDLMVKWLIERKIEHLETLFGHMLDKHKALNRLLDWLELGARKYDRHNWQKGMPLSRVLDSLGRHFMALEDGRTDEDHHAAALCNIMFLIHYEYEIRAGRLPEELDDLPRYGPEPPAIPNADKRQGDPPEGVVALTKAYDEFYATFGRSPKILRVGHAVDNNLRKFAPIPKLPLGPHGGISWRGCAIRVSQLLEPNEVEAE